MRSLVRSLLACFLSLQVACAQWETQTRPIPELLDAHPRQLLVTRRDSSTVILIDPVVTDSSLVGAYRTPRGKVRRDSTVHVPLSDIASAATWNPGSSALFWAVPVGLLGLLVAGVATCFVCPST